MGIQRLPSAVVSSLRTDVTVTTIAQCATELVLNSIDAGASAVAVRADLQNLRIQVVDNGCGLSSSDLNVIGTRYMTSKCHSLRDLQYNLSHFGFRGEALASITEVCGTMTIVSRCQGSEETYCKVFTRGMAHSVGKSRTQRASCGTTITVADFLYNRPVRKARIKPALDLENIKLHLESIALINSHISFSLRNDSNNEMILQTQRVETIPAAFSILFGACNAKNLVAVKESMGPFTVEGYISNEAHLLKNLQFIYINKRLLLKTKIHKLVNSLMSRSAILKSNNVPYVPISKELNHGVLLAFSPPKRHKHAIFILNIICPFSEYDITLDPKKTFVEFCNWDCLLSCIESLLRKFIDKEAKADKEQTFGSGPTRIVQSVVDEINQLARENALGADVSLTTEETICTRDISRAVHSLPANRCQVNLSPVPPQEIMSVTASSEGTASFVLSTLEKGHTATSIPSSVLTEEPYPPLLHTNPLKYDSRVAASKGETCGKETESSLVSQVSLKCLRKSSEDKSFHRRGSVKGFLADKIHFQENFRKIPDSPRIISSDKASVVSSPLNALASIKEIRRKKLLNNLNKFSFKMACEKPVLHKTQLRASIKFGLKADQEENTVLAISGKLFKSYVEDSKAGKSSLVSPVNSYQTNDIEPMASLIATVQSSDADVSMCTGIENDDFVQTACSSLLPKCLQSTKKQEIVLSGDVFKVKHSEEYQNVLSEERNLTCPDLKQKISASFISSGTTADFNQAPTPACPKAHDDLAKSLESKNKVTADSYIVHASEGEQPSIKVNIEEFSNRESACIEKEPFSSCETFAANPIDQQDILCSELSQDPQILSHASLGDQTVGLKIVDYDSSPSSSQEAFQNLDKSVENDSGSPSELKRKLVKPHEQKLKKFCSSFESSTSIQHEEVDGNHDTCQNKLNACDPKEDGNLRLIGACLGSPNLMKSDLAFQHLKRRNEETVRDLNYAQDKDPNKSLSGCANLDRNKDTSGHPLEVNAYQIEKSCSPGNHEESQWTVQLDHSGKQFFIHKTSGITTYQRPNEDKKDAFKFGDRFLFLPKGMSPILYDKCTNEPSNSPSISNFKIEEDLSSVKWGMENSDKKTDFWPLVDQLLSESNRFSSNMCAESHVSNATVQELSQTDIGVYNVMCPYSFTKDIFNNLRVLGQLDNKFIVTIVSLDSKKDVIVLFDQHAVHERIRVENLTEEYKQHDGCATWRSAAVEPALPLSLTSFEVRILESYMAKMERLGFYFSIVDSNTINVLRVPTCLLLRENREVTGRGVSVLRQHLESLIREQVDSLLNTRGVGSDHPTIIRNVISSEACRGAVKFGHTLTVADCQAFLHNLSQCDLPFQCAHGRPALVPILDLSMLKQKQKILKTNLQRLRN